MSDIQERIAPPGQIWVCHACGKTSEDSYGIEGKHSYGWDESCSLNCALHPIDKLVRDDYGRVTEIKP